MLPVHTTKRPGLPPGPSNSPLVTVDCNGLTDHLGRNPATLGWRSRFRGRVWAEHENADMLHSVMRKFLDLRIMRLHQNLNEAWRREAKPYDGDRSLAERAIACGSRPQIAHPQDAARHWSRTKLTVNLLRARRAALSRPRRPPAVLLLSESRTDRRPLIAAGGLIPW